MEETNAARLKDVVRMYPLAIVIILPDAEATLQLSEEQQQNWLEVESMLLEGEYPIPIYFALQSETVMQVLSDLKEITSTDSGSSAAKGRFLFRPLKMRRNLYSGSLVFFLTQNQVTQIIFAIRRVIYHIKPFQS